MDEISRAGRSGGAASPGSAQDLAEVGHRKSPTGAAGNPLECPTGSYRAIEKTPNGWCMVVGPTVPEHAGPWRYLWEAQDYADELPRPLRGRQRQF